MKIRLPSSSSISRYILRVPLGLSMFVIGISAYRDFTPFVANVSDGLAWATPLGVVWAYVLPLLFIVGGGILVSGRHVNVAGLIGGIGLGSIPLGLILRNVIGGVPLSDTMVAVYPWILWIVAFSLAILEPASLLGDDGKGSSMA